MTMSIAEAAINLAAALALSRHPLDLGALGPQPGRPAG